MSAGPDDPATAAAPAAGSGKFSIVCFSSQEWANPLPTNRQQIMRRAAARGHDVLFVETGDFVGRHVVRLLTGPDRRSLARRLLVSKRVEERIAVRKAVNVLPWGQRFALANAVNGWVTRHVVRRATRSLAAPRVTWLYEPRANWAIGAVGDVFGVYDCVDDYAEQTSSARNRALVAAADREAARRAAVVFATTKALFERHRATNRRTVLVGNAADYEHFAPAVDRAYASVELTELPRPVLGFVGNIAANKVDLDLLRALADRDGAQRTILLAGPADPAIRDELVELATRENVRWVGPVPYADVPRVVAAFDVALIPYLENAYTRNVFPLKLYEYLAAGKPVVATGLPELAGLEPDVQVVHRGQVEDAIRRALDRRTDVDVARRRAMAAKRTWETRTERLLAFVRAELDAHESGNRPAGPVTSRARDPGRGGR